MALHTGLALFAGGGGLELGLKLALGEDRYKCVAYVERSAEAASVLATQMERGGLDKGVIWDDVTTFTGDVVSPFVDNIDIISAGFPCQPWSVAGARKGTEDERWLWPHIFRLVREIRPRSIFLENVPGLLHGGIEHVLGDLASVGFDAEWISVRASDVGAPHRRERVFILAYARNGGYSANTGRGGETNSVSGECRTGIFAGVSGGASRILAHSDQWTRIQCQQQKGSGHTFRGKRELGNAESERLERRSGDNDTTRPGQSSEKMDDTNDEGLQGWRRYGKCGNELPAWPPSPSDTYAWEEVLRERPDLAPAVESEVRGMDDGVPRGLARSQQLRILGNSVVAKQAALAFQILKERN